MQSETNSTAIQFPSNYQNTFKTDNNEMVFKVKYQFKYSKIDFNTEVNLNYWNAKSDNTEAKLWYLNPNFGLKFSPHQKANLNFSVFANHRKNDVYDRLPNYFSDTPRSFRRGLENEFLTKNYGLSLSYNYGHFTDKFNFSFFGSWLNHDKYQSNRYEFHPLYTISELVYLNDRTELFLSSQLSYFLSFLKSNLKFRYLNSTNNYQENLEPIGLVDVKTVSHSFGLELQSGWKKKINYTLASTLRYHDVYSNIKTSILNHKAYMRINYAISKSYFLELYNYYYSFGGMFKKNNSYNFLDIRMSYNASDKLQFVLSGNNLTNTKIYAEKFISSYSNYLSETKMFPRNFMLEFNYNFGN